MAPLWRRDKGALVSASPLAAGAGFPTEGPSPYLHHHGVPTVSTHDSDPPVTTLRIRCQNRKWNGGRKGDGLRRTFSTSAFVTLMSASILSKYCLALSASLQSRSNFLLHCGGGKKKKGNREKEAQIMYHSNYGYDTSADNDNKRQ